MYLVFRVLLNTSVMLIFIGSVATQAMPSSSGCSTIRKSRTTDLHDLIQPISLIYQRDEHGRLVKEDKRQMLKDLKGPHVDEAFKLRVRRNSGFVYCKSDDPDVAPWAASGSLYGNGLQLTTAIHVIQKEVNPFRSAGL